MNFQITEYCHHILEEYIEEGDICIDATAGNGGDTEFLCQKVGETGNVYAFDDINIYLLTSSCTLHRRKFRTNVSVHICINVSVSACKSFSITLKIY